MTTNFVVQRQRAVWHTTMLGLVSTGVHAHLLTTYCLILKRAFCHFLVSLAEILSQLIHISQLMYVFSTLEVPILPRTEARTTYPGPECV